MLVFRTLFGFGMGAEWTAGTALAMESFPPSKRKLASGLLQAGWPVGFLIAAATAYFVVPAFGWRAMFLIAARAGAARDPDPACSSRETRGHADAAQRRKARSSDLADAGRPRDDSSSARS